MELQHLCYLAPPPGMMWENSAIIFVHVGYMSDILCVLQNIENFMKDVYKSRYGEDIQDDSVKLLYSLAVSIFAIGGMLGGFCGGMIANRFGR
jgi:MFS family permease